MKLVIFILFLSPLTSAMSVEYQNYFLFQGNEKVAIPMTNNEGVLINDKCFNDLKKCQAYKKYKKPIKETKFKQNNLSTMAAAYCKQISGVPLILKDNNFNSVGFCAFEDKSMIGSWELYNNYLKNIKKKSKK